MALSEEMILQQLNVLTKKTAENAEMVYKAIPALNKGLNPEYFTGNETKIVNAINKIAAEIDMLNHAVVDMIGRVNSILLDIGGTENKETWEKTQELMGTDNIIEGIKAILEGKQQEKILDLHLADVGKILSVIENENGDLEVKATSIDSLNVEVGSYDVAYINRDYKGINSVGEAIDHILDHIQQPIPWEQLSNVPDLANNLVLENENLTLKSNDVELANIPITNDVDIENMINSLDI